MSDTTLANKKSKPMTRSKLEALVTYIMAHNMKICLKHCVVCNGSIRFA